MAPGIHVVVSALFRTGKEERCLTSMRPEQGFILKNMVMVIR